MLCSFAWYIDMIWFGSGLGKKKPGTELNRNGTERQTETFKYPNDFYISISEIILEYIKILIIYTYNII